MCRYRQRASALVPLKRNTATQTGLIFKPIYLFKSKPWSLGATITRLCKMANAADTAEGSVSCLPVQYAFTGAYSPGWTFGLPFRGFCDHTPLDTHGRTSLDEWSARRRGLYLHRTSQRIDTTNIYVPSGIRTCGPSNQVAASPWQRSSC
jgi:hypothetical protein